MAPTKSGQLLGYARVSTAEQEPRLQLDALIEAGCEKTFTEKTSGVASNRPALVELLKYARPGDTIVVWRLDRLGRSLRQLVDAVADLEERGLELRSLKEEIDTRSPGGRLTFHIFAALAEFERDLIRERTYAGLEAARARGRVGGRPTVMTAERIDTARSLLSERDEDNRPVHTMESAAKVLGVSRAAIYRAFKREEEAGDA